MVIKKFMRLGPLELIILLCLLTALVNLLQYLGGREDGPPAAEGSIATCTLPTGSFDVIQRDGYLQPVDQKTGAVAGLLQRWPNGEIQLTTAEGFAPNVTPCLYGKLNTEQLNSLPLHD